MKHFSGFDNIFETETWYFWGNMKVILGYLDWGLDNKVPHSDPADKIILGLVSVLSAMFLSVQTFC